MLGLWRSPKRLLGSINNLGSKVLGDVTICACRGCVLPGMHAAVRRENAGQELQPWGWVMQWSGLKLSCGETGIGAGIGVFVGSESTAWGVVTECWPAGCSRLVRSLNLLRCVVWQESRRHACARARTMCQRHSFLARMTLSITLCIHVLHGGSACAGGRPVTWVGFRIPELPAATAFISVTAVCAAPDCIS